MRTNSSGCTGSPPTIHSRGIGKGANRIKERFALRVYGGRHAALLNDLLEYTRSLREASQAFCEIANPHDAAAFASITDEAVREEVKYANEKLRRTRQLASFLPLLIAARLRYPQDGAASLAAVEFCERFAFRVYVFMRMRPSAGQARLFRFGHGVYQRQMTLQEAVVRANALALQLVPQRRLETEFQLADDRNWYDWQGIKYFLYEYEEHRTGRKQVKLAWDVLDGRDKEKSIEHILPQTPTARYWHERFSGKEIADLTHDIGNLCLTQDNSSLGNKAFPDKKGEVGSDRPGYANSLLVQERELASFQEWTPATLLTRREKLVQWALTRWAIDESASTIDVGSEDDDLTDDESVVAESLELLDSLTEQENGRRQNRPPRGTDWWQWYLEVPKHPLAVVEIVRQVVERIEAIAPTGWTTKPAKNQIGFLVNGRKRVRVVFWGGKVKVALPGHPAAPDPDLFDLPGKVTRGAWAWEVSRLEEVPLDMTPLVRLIEDAG